MSEIIERNKEAYRKAVSKQDKSKIVDGIASSTGMHRKAVIRALNRTSDVVRINNENITTKPKKRLGRPPTYIGEVDVALEEVWQVAGCLCAELLVDFRSELIRILRRDGMWRYTIEATNDLLRMSTGTLKRKIAKLNRKYGLARGISTTSSSGSIKQLVPVFIGNYRHMGLGYGQIDTVVHSGPKLMGIMAYSVLYVDMETCWTVVTAQYGKTPEATLLSIQRIAQILPWRIRGLHPDNGSEFLNGQVLNYCRSRNIELTRSRPYKKKGNC